MTPLRQRSLEAVYWLSTAVLIFGFLLFMPVTAVHVWSKKKLGRVWL